MFAMGETPVRAELGDDRVWICLGYPAVASVLNGAYSPGQTEGPAYGPDGHAIATAAAKFFGGSVEFPHRKPAPDGVDY